MKNISEFSDDELKSIIMDGIMNYRNPNHPSSKFNHEKVSVGFEIITYTRKNPTTEEQKRVDIIHNELISFLAE